MMILRHWDVLKKPAVLWFTLSCFFAAIGWGSNYIFLSWMILGIDNSLQALTNLMLCTWAPVVILGISYGIFADRLRKKTLLILVNLLRILILAGITLFWIEKHITTREIYFIGLSQGILGAIYTPTAAAYIREIVTNKQLLQANAVIDITYELGSLVGMASAGFLLAILYWHGLLINASLFFISMLCVLGISTDIVIQTPSEKKPFFSNLCAGFTYLKLNKHLILIYTAESLIMITFFASPILLAIFAKNILHANAMEFGLLEGSLSLGIVIGGIMNPILASLWPYRQIIFIEIIALIALFSLFSINSNLALANFIYFFLGIAFGVAILVTTKAQLLTDPHFYARIYSAFFSLTGLVLVLFYVFLGSTANFIHLRFLYMILSLLALIALYLLWILRKIL